MPFLPLCVATIDSQNICATQVLTPSSFTPTAQDHHRWADSHSNSPAAVEACSNAGSPQAIGEPKLAHESCDFHYDLCTQVISYNRLQIASALEGLLAVTALVFLVLQCHVRRARVAKTLGLEERGLASGDEENNFKPSAEEALPICEGISEGKEHGLAHAAAARVIHLQPTPLETSWIRAARRVRKCMQRKLFPGKRRKPFTFQLLMKLEKVSASGEPSTSSGGLADDDSDEIPPSLLDLYLKDILEAAQEGFLAEWLLDPDGEFLQSTAPSGKEEEHLAEQDLLPETPPFLESLKEQAAWAQSVIFARERILFTKGPVHLDFRNFMKTGFSSSKFREGSEEASTFKSLLHSPRLLPVTQFCVTSGLVSWFSLVRCVAACEIYSKKITFSPSTLPFALSRGWVAKEGWRAAFDLCCFPLKVQHSAIMGMQTNS
ncbi:hypothetical protein Esti_006888 [Eimeria stiedai]